MRDNDLIGYLSQAYQREEAFWKLLAGLPVDNTLRPGQMLFKHSGQCETYFVHRGMIKGFYYDEKGREHVTRFWNEGQVILLADASQPGITTADHLQAVEASMLSQISFSSTAALKLSAGQTARFASRVLMADRNMAELKAHLCALPARQAYDEFKKYLPESRLPLRDIASFLGITPQTISEIRKNAK